MKTNQLRNFKTTIVDFIRSKQLVLIFIKGFSYFNHQLSLFFFKNQIVESQIKNIRDSFSRHNPCYLWFPMLLLSLGVADAAPKIGNQPFHNSGIGIADSNSGTKVNPCSIDFISLSQTFGFSFHNPLVIHGYGSFSIQDTGKIGKLSNCIFHKLEVYHKMDNKVHRERLNPANPKGYAIV